jgi:hypothetical protein
MNKTSAEYRPRNRFGSIPLIKFWLGLRNKFPMLAIKTVAVLLLFSTAYLCEKAFSS